MPRGGKYYKQGIVFRTAVRERDHYTCQLCGKPAKDVDHIVPYYISRETTLEGCRVLCHSCNCQNRRNKAKTQAQYWEDIQYQADIYASW